MCRGHAGDKRQLAKAMTRTTKLILLAGALWALGCGIVASESLPYGQSQIIDGPRCSAVIGSGGNLRLPSGETLPGKCEGAGAPPTLTEDGRVIEFNVRSDRQTPKDRSELAFTDKRSRLRFGVEYVVSFDVNIPESSDVTNEFFYVAQFWQNPGRPPIAGLRIQRGQDNRGAVMARGDGSRPGGRPVVYVDFPPDEWVNVAIRLMVKPGDGSCIGASINKGPETSWCGVIGYASEKPHKPFYRFKFGIYKGSEPGKSFRVRFRNVSISAVGPGWQNGRTLQ